MKLVVLIFLIISSVKADLDSLVTELRRQKIPKNQPPSLKKHFHVQVMDSDIVIDSSRSNVSIHSPVEKREFLSQRLRNELLNRHGLYSIVPSEFSELDYDIFFFHLRSKNFESLLLLYPFLDEKRESIKSFKGEKIK